MKIRDLINENLEKITGLFSGYVFFLTTFFISLKTLFPDVSHPYDLIFYATILICWTTAWFFIRESFPKNEKGKIGIVISITAENDKQKIRLKEDFVKRLNDQALNNRIDHLIKFVLIGSTKTSRVNIILTHFSSTLDKTRVQDDNGISRKKAFFKLNKKIKGHFFIWGSIKERLNSENRYYLDLNGIVLHPPLNDPIQANLAKEFSFVWVRSINFLEKFEFLGFEFSADIIFDAVEYITGLAALFSGGVELAEKLHSRLENNIKSRNQSLPSVQHIQKSLSDLIPHELSLLAAIELNNGHVKASEDLLQKAFRRVPDIYSGLITQSLLRFKYKGDPRGALSSVRLAKKNAGVDGTWRYNEAFLLMYLERFTEAVPLYLEIVQHEFPGEDRVLSDVLEFNKTMINQNKEFYQSYFILGFLYYKKKSNYPEALYYFEYLRDNCKNKKYGILLKISSDYLSRITKEMEL